MAVRANTQTIKAEISEKDKLVIADFYSDSCIPCKRMSPLLAETEESDPENIKLVKLNINFDAEAAAEYGVTSVPTLIFFRNGEEKARLTGAVKKAQLAETINKIEQENV
ncbi:thioredoxin domain-containing protein [uncultured Ruminococcus sp.]|uniref:thioredoxin family protein n=1 Tax=uncultured Ruminococcus sp. TaxID=165186 RepID=UPI0025FBBBDC|nr:thioredoxin domain-containing protein [uncultured Ruminococcus sp.]